MEAAITVLKFMEAHHEEFLNWDEIEFGSFICMAMEEWCRRRNLNVVEYSGMIAEMIREVNGALGKYE